MKNFVLFAAFLFGTTVIAQAPANYYNTATGTGYTLKTQLYNIINDHDNQGYSALYNIYLTSDRDYYYENDGTVLDMYSEKPAGPDSYTYSATNSNDRCGNYSGEGDCYNREHIVPQSVFNSANPMYADAHFVVPTDGYVNGVRGNLPFGRVGSANYTSTNGSKRGPNLNSGYSAGYSGTVFEPIDEFKGDIARMYFYFATRYQNLISSWDYDMFNGTSNEVFTLNAKNILMTWHMMDPVSPREIARNNAIFAQQDNRNPFIDHPEWVETIWGPLLGTEDYAHLESAAVYPNPAVNGKVFVQTEMMLEEIEIITINGQLFQRIPNPVQQDNNYVIDGLRTGFYFLKLKGEGQSVTKKIIVN